MDEENTTVAWVVGYYGAFCYGIIIIIIIIYHYHHRLYNSGGDGSRSLFREKRRKMRRSHYRMLARCAHAQFKVLRRNIILYRFRVIV